MTQPEAARVERGPITEVPHFALGMAALLERQGFTVAANELRRLHAELERERMRLVACGVVALADTPDSAKHARQMHPDYESASCQDVARRVDECISLRAQRDALLEALQDLCDEQEGPPLVRRHRQWQAAIDKARAAIAKAEENT